MKIPVIIIKGHGAASGQKRDPRYPEGTLVMQWPYFLDAGIDLRGLFQGTINVDIRPFRFEIKRPFRFVESVNWSQYISPENFYFFQVSFYYDSHQQDGLIYLPDPRTKEEHFQPSSMLELLLPKIEGIKYNERAEIEVPSDQMIFYR